MKKLKRRNVICLIVELVLIFIITGADCNSPTTNNQNNSSIDYRQAMRDFVVMISANAKQENSNFIITPQNGQEIITADGESDGSPAVDYLNAIDGVGREDLWYGYDEDDQPTPGSESNYMAEFLDLAESENSQVLVTDYCSTQTFVDDSYKKNQSKGYISFAADRRELDNIPVYPAEPYNGNQNNIQTLEDASNFLYLINPQQYNTKTDFLNALRNTNFDLLIIDLFFNDNTELTQTDINSLKIKTGGGSRLVVAYMSIGEAETYRYYWQTEWENNPPVWLEEENPNWPGNYKVRYWDPGWQEIIFGNNEAYLTKIIDADFDGIYLDIIDAFEYFEDL